MSDFSIGRSAKRAVSSVGVKAHHSTGKIMGPPRLRDGVSCIDFSGTLYSRLLKTTTWLLFCFPRNHLWDSLVTHDILVRI